MKHLRIFLANLRQWSENDRDVRMTSEIDRNFRIFKNSLENSHNFCKIYCILLTSVVYVIRRITSSTHACILLHFSLQDQYKIKEFEGSGNINIILDNSNKPELGKVSNLVL